MAGNGGDNISIQENELYYNYHKHDYYGNPIVLDTIASIEDYCKRAKELGHNAIFTTNHGFQGNLFDTLQLAQTYGLKAIVGVEGYYVTNRKDKDKSNRHIVIIALNDEGVREINDIMSEANISGFYYRPRIDKELLFSLSPQNVVVTTACVAGVWKAVKKPECEDEDYTDAEQDNNEMHIDAELVLALKNHFGNHFFLEVQDHNEEIQKTANRLILNFSKATGMPIIHGNDSHYIYGEDAKYRNLFLKAKEPHRPVYEDNFILDYPSAGEIVRRYRTQGVLTDDEIETAIKNTRIFDQCENLTLIDDSIKLPSISIDPYNELEEIIYNAWEKEKRNITPSRWKEYEDAIAYEIDIVHRTHMEDYFILDYKIVKLAQEKYGGLLTNTGRGSAPSFYIVKLLGLTDIDRLDAPITLFPTRFMSVERILGARSLPDIDLNTADVRPFIRATKDLLKDENCAWMIAWKPLQDSSAFRLYCKAIGLHISEYDEIAKNLDQYKDDPKWKKIIQESKHFVGVVEGISESPCSMLLYDKPVRREIGLIRMKDDKGKKPKNQICCLLTGVQCDHFKYLKNDYLTVTVWAIIKRVCEMAGIAIPTIKELNNLLDKKTFDIYENGLTCSINQADSDYATGLVKTYKPKSLAEMSAFVAIIRPGCYSLLDGFINREEYTTGIGELDDLLEEGSHRMIYQELIMKYLIWLGIPETGSYDIIKRIAKKRFKEPELAALKEKLLSGWMKNVGTKDGFIETWTVVEQAAHYSFNASHSLSYAYDSLYGAYLKSHYPLEYFTVVLNQYDGDLDRTKKLVGELPHFGINLKPIQFRHSRAAYSCDKESMSIYKGIGSVKFLTEGVSEAIYDLRDNQYNNFFELLDCIRLNKIANNRQIEILIKLNFFKEFGNINTLLFYLKLHDEFSDTKVTMKEKLAAFGIPIELAATCFEKETAKQLRGFNKGKFFSLISQNFSKLEPKLSEIVNYQQEYLGYIDYKDPERSGTLYVLDVNTKYSPKITVYSIKNGTTMTCKVGKRLFRSKPIAVGTIIQVRSTERKDKLVKNENGDFVPIEGETELWITNYSLTNL